MKVLLLIYCISVFFTSWRLLYGLILDYKLTKWLNKPGSDSYKANMRAIKYGVIASIIICFMPVLNTIALTYMIYGELVDGRWFKTKGSRTPD